MNKTNNSAGKRRAGRTKPKAVVTVSEMAALVGLSCSRFYALVKEGVMPPPVYEMFAHRAVYPQPLQQVCRYVRWCGRGMNGRTVRFRRKV